MRNDKWGAKEDERMKRGMKTEEQGEIKGRNGKGKVTTQIV